jgi:hypothetical protein
MRARARREVNLDHGRVTVECRASCPMPSLADVLAAFVEEVKARPAKAVIPAEPAVRPKSTRRR